MDMFKARRVVRTDFGSKSAHSRRTSVVASSTSECSPPITPPIPTGFSASQIRSMSVEIFRASSSSVVKVVSPARARRTTMRDPASLPRSYACIGWPSSSMM